MSLLTGAGRVGRLHYIGIYVVVVVVMITAALVSISTDELTGQTQANPLFIVVALAGVWVANTNVVRRLHDCGHSGWLALLGLVPIISFGLGLYLLFTSGDPGRNRYGPPPGHGDQLPPEARRQRLDQIVAAAADAHATRRAKQEVF